ncbi:MAG: DUF3429 domain-containing protein [Novosphingobium sp.]
MLERRIARLVTIGTAFELVPLLLALPAVAFPELAPLDPVILERAIVGYAALCLAFLGGVRWGIGLCAGDGTNAVYLLGALGPALGLAALLFPFGPALSLLTVGFAAQGAWDAWSGHRKTVPDAYARQRIGATLATCLVLIVILFARAAHG